MKTIRVMLIDNNASFLQLASDYLKSSQDIAVVGTALNSHDALSQASDLLPDVVLLDIRMSNQNGLEILPQLRMILPYSAIIILSMYDLDVYRDAAQKAGAVGYVLKKNMVAELLPVVRRAINDNKRE